MTLDDIRAELQARRENSHLAHVDPAFKGWSNRDLHAAQAHLSGIGVDTSGNPYWSGT